MAAELAFPIAFEHNGLLFVVGYRDGRQYIRRSADGGVTWLKFPDGSVEKPVGEGSDPQRAAFVKTDTQGCRLVVGIARWPNIEIYISPDDGVTWEYEGSIQADS